jgi:hypothetical protein
VHGKKKTGAQKGSSPCRGVPREENDNDDAETAEIEDVRRSGKEAGALGRRAVRWRSDDEGLARPAIAAAKTSRGDGARARMGC